MSENASPSPFSPNQFLRNQKNPSDKQPLCKYPPGLYIVSTPIGNLEDITIRALNTLANADLIVCEDTRHTQKLLNHFGLKKKLLAYFDHNDDHARPKILKALEEGLYVALVSDAGTPLVSDPGYKLIRAVVAEGYYVTAIPGPSSLLAGLVISGLPSDHFYFEGFLPSKEQARRNRLKVLSSLAGTLIFFESPQRLVQSLRDMLNVLGNREAAVTRELTKKFETCQRGTLETLATFYEQEEIIKGELVVFVSGPLEESREDRLHQIDLLLLSLFKTTSLKEAVSQATEITGYSKKEVYQRALALKEEKL